MYNAKSLKAEEFIDHDEVMATLDYAWENRHNEQLIDKILRRDITGGISVNYVSLLILFKTWKISF